jgi:tetratricopeptide (TPR) repeat protein
MMSPLALAAALLLTAAPGAPGGAAPEAQAHWTIQTSDPQVQALFDRGLMMLYAFDVGEAQVAFGAAVQRDPDCAMAYWGLAEADAIDINQPSTPEGEKRGEDAVAKARAHLAHAAPAERDLIEAMRARYGKGTTSAKFARYADAMTAFAKAHQDEPNGLVIAGFAVYTANDALVDAQNEMTPKAREVLADVDRALVLEPSNLGAHHLRVHLLEEVRRWDDAVPDAAALEAFQYPLGESHLPHMAGHIWARTGEYDRLVNDNVRAVDNDRAWFALGNGPGQKYMQYYHDHDVDFVLYGLTTEGRNDEARTFAAREDTFSQVRLALRLHDDARIEQLDTSGVGAIAFAHAVAAARLGQLDVMRAESAKTGALDGQRANLIEAARALGAHDPAARVAAYARAYAATKTDLPGDPKNYWSMPIGEGYGAALLAADRPALAETVFAAELKRFPNDPHLEWGLARALAAQGKDDTVPRAAYRAHWKGTRDLTLDDLG